MKYDIHLFIYWPRRISHHFETEQAFRRTISWEHLVTTKQGLSRMINQGISTSYQLPLVGVTPAHALSTRGELDLSPQITPPLIRQIRQTSCHHLQSQVVASTSILWLHPQRLRNRFLQEFQKYQWVWILVSWHIWINSKVRHHSLQTAMFMVQIKRV